MFHPLHHQSLGQPFQLFQPFQTPVVDRRNNFKNIMAVHSHYMRHIHLFICIWPVSRLHGMEAHPLIRAPACRLSLRGQCLLLQTLARINKARSHLISSIRVPFYTWDNFIAVALGSNEHPSRLCHCVNAALIDHNPASCFV